MINKISKLYMKFYILYCVTNILFYYHTCIRIYSGHIMNFNRLNRLIDNILIECFNDNMVPIEYDDREDSFNFKLSNKLYIMSLYDIYFSNVNNHNFYFKTKKNILNFKETLDGYLWTDDKNIIDDNFVTRTNVNTEIILTNLHIERSDDNVSKKIYNFFDHFILSLNNRVDFSKEYDFNDNCNYEIYDNMLYDEYSNEILLKSLLKNKYFLQKNPFMKCFENNILNDQYFYSEYRFHDYFENYLYSGIDKNYFDHDDMLPNIYNHINLPIIFYLTNLPNLYKYNLKLTNKVNIGYYSVYKIIMYNNDTLIDIGRAVSNKYKNISKIYIYNDKSNIDSINIGNI
jgi:hypothetical protein